MARALSFAVATAILIAVAAAGCGFGPGEEQEGEATIRITRDHGSELLADAVDSDPAESETVVRLLDRETEIETSYGGNFVDSIEGLETSAEDGRRFDWYYYVNGYWAPIGAGERRVYAGDRIWWDYRDWTDVYRVPAVVGSYPEPFRSGWEGERIPTELVCFPSGDETGACDGVEEDLRAADAELTVSDSTTAGADPADTIRVLVGEWSEVRSDRTARRLEDGTRASGVYGRPLRCGAGWGFEAFDPELAPAGSSSSAAWVATVLEGDDQPTWLISASSPAELGAAAAMLDEETLRDHYAVADFGAGSFPLPAEGGAGGAEECG